eukprot:g2774.t1
MVALKKYSYDEIKLHNKATDCWLVIDDKVYDVTSFVEKHPGGNMIFLNAGRESTYLFKSYHPKYVNELLPKYLIGEVQDTDPFRVKYANEEEDLKQYYAIKAAVHEYFKERKKDPRICPAMYVKTVLILVAYLLSFYAMHFYFEQFWSSCFCAFLMGFFAAEIGVSVQHDANHGSYHKNPKINKYVGLTLDFAGASSFIWKQQHVFGHHVYTNINSLDPDIRVNDPDVRRSTQFQPWRRYQVYQHLYLGFLYGLLSIKSIFIDDITMLLTGKIGPVPVNHIHRDELVVFCLGKIVFVSYYILLPLFYSHYGVMSLVKLWLVAQFTTGWILAFMFQVNHITDEVDFYEKNGEKLDIGWTRSQIEGTSNFAPGSWLWTNISGGLNYQIEHHLFPGMCHMYYPEIAPIVKRFCKEYGIKYSCYPTLLSALKGHFNHMKTIGGGLKAD